LHYVRYRHNDTDLVRNARQQDFLRQIKNQLGAGGLISRRFGIEKIFGKYASTDIRSADDVLKLLELLVQSAGHPVRQVGFQSAIGPSYVTATPGQLRRTVHEFLHGGIAPGHIRVSTKSHKAAPKSFQTPLSPATSTELAGAQGLASSVPFRVFYPVDRITTGGADPDFVRSYSLHGHPAYVVVVAQGGLGQYYDVEGTTWTKPPLLTHPSQTVQIGRRHFQLYFEGQRIRVVAWHDGAAVYWLTNTLQNILSNRQMLAIASAARPVH
jgi:hypothetical protein